MEMFWENFQSAILTGTGALILFLVHYYLILPWDIRRDLSDIGFDYLTNGSYKSACNKKENKRELVRQVQRLRNVGDLPPVYPNGWFALLESEDLKKNEVRHVVALGENFAVFRNSLGEVKILDAYCPHLGANMAIGGIVRGNCLECPFHSWKFDGETGQCSSVPYSEKTPDFIKVRKWECIEVNDFIFVWYHAENEKASWYPEVLDVIKSKKLSYHGRMELLIGCHIQEIEENAADSAHFNIIHSPAFTFLNSYLRLKWNVQWDPSPVDNHLATVNVSSSLDARIFNKFSLSIAQSEMTHVGPGYALTAMNWMGFTNIVVQMTITPVEALVQKLNMRIYAPYMSMFHAKLILYGGMKNFEQDILVWNHKKYLMNPMLIKEDQTIPRFRRWFQQFYSANSPKFSYQKDTLAW